MKKSNVYLLIIFLAFINLINAQDTVKSVNPNIQPVPKDSIVKKDKILYSIYFNYSHFSYKDKDSVNVSKLLNKKGTSGFGLGISAVYLFPNDLFSLGLSADINFLPAKYSNNYYLFDSQHYEDVINYDAYIRDYSVKYKEIPFSINIKAALYPNRILSPFVEMGLSYRTITLKEKGTYQFSTPYDTDTINPLSVPFDHKFSSGVFCFKPSLGLNFKAGKNISIFGKVSYLKAKYKKIVEVYPHRDVVYTNNPSLGANYATNAFVPFFQNGYYEGWLLSFGLSYNFNDLKFWSNKTKKPLL